MSLFGFISLFIVVVSVAVIILHYRLMKRRAPVDVHFGQLEELLRHWLENLYQESPEGSELYYLCGQCIDLELNGLLSAAPQIVEAYNHAAYSETEPQDQNAEIAAIRETIKALNLSIAAYNAFITKSPAAALMALVLGLKTVEPVVQIFVNELSAAETETDEALQV